MAALNQVRRAGKVSHRLNCKKVREYQAWKVGLRRLSRAVDQKGPAWHSPSCSERGNAIESRAGGPFAFLWTNRKESVSCRGVDGFLCCRSFLWRFAAPARCVPTTMT